jgi:CubicO group peptidase (beta-lactamase class C family)
MGWQAVVQGKNPAFIICLVLSGLSLAHANSGVLERHQGELKQTRAKLQQLIERQQLDGVSIGVVSQHGLIWFDSAGYANRKKGIKASENTMYRVGSLTKLFTAAAILQLEDEGIIDIDQAASAYIPRFYYKTRFSDPGVITPRNLLTHLSGLPSNLNKGHWSEERFSDLVERLRIEYTAYPVDFISNYSNIGYSLLGIILEENTDYLYEEYLQKHLFDPLEMTRSNFNPYGSGDELAAIGYKNHQPQQNLPLRDIPAMGLNSNITELSHFVQAILNRGRYKEQQILPGDSVEAMFREQNSDIALDFDNQTGIPWQLSRSSDNQTLLAEHSGTTINFSSHIILAPEKQLGVIILSNSSQANRKIRNVASSLLSHLIDSHNLPANSQASTQTEPISPPLNTGADKQRYIAKSGIIEIDKSANKLCQCQTQKILNLVPLPNGWFGLSPDNRHISSKISEQEIDGEEVIVLEKNGQKHRVGARLKPADNRFNWEQYFGDYEIINPDENFPVTDVRVFDEDNMTYICYRMPQLSDKLVVLPITPVSETEAITEGLGRSKGETIYSRKINGEDLLIYSGYIARKKRPQQATAN